MIHVNGIDVSDWQGSPNWSAVQGAGYSFAFAKATEGTGNVQTSFPENMKAVRASNGMLFGAYHFFDWTQDATAQAEHFLSIYTPKAGDLPPMLDLEGSPKISATTAAGMISEFLSRVEAVTKKHCFIYCGYYFWRDQLDATTGFAGHPLWLPLYETGDAPSIQPEGWPVTIWQYSQEGSVAGISGNVDLDWFLGDVYALRALCIE